jgi:hypothetical protein
MNLLNQADNEFEKVVITNSFYTIYETRAFINFKKGDRFEFSFDEISSIRIVKKEKNTFPILFILISATIAGLFFSIIEKNSLYQVLYLVSSGLFFILTFYVKKTTYKLCIDNKNSVLHRFTIKKEMLGDVKTFVQTIREIKKKIKKIASANQTK